MERGQLEPRLLDNTLGEQDAEHCAQYQAYPLQKGNHRRMGDDDGAGEQQFGEDEAAAGLLWEEVGENGVGVAGGAGGASVGDDESGDGELCDGALVDGRVAVFGEGEGLQFAEVAAAFLDDGIGHAFEQRDRAGLRGVLARHVGGDRG